MRIALIVLCFSLCLRIQAQQTVYNLDTPDVDEFLAGLPDFTTIEFTDDMSNHAREKALEAIIKTTELEFLWRYENLADMATLSTMFDHLRVSVFCYPVPRCTWRLEAIDMADWLERILARWLIETNIDLNTIEQTEINDYTLSIEPRDFNADGQNEWLIEVIIGDINEPDFAQYFVLSETNTGYHIAVVPLIGTLNWSRHYIDEQPLTEIIFDDLNQDGLPEWVFAWTSSYVTPASIYGSNHAAMFAWREGDIERIARIRRYSGFDNLDDDDSIEINLIRDSYRDYWGCGYTETSYLDWDGEQYIETDPQITQFDCTARHAEDAMWAWDFETASRYYDDYLENASSYIAYENCIQSAQYDCEVYRDLLIYFYFQVRRILAYALQGNQDIVSGLLEDLQAQEYKTNFSEAILIANSTDGETLCFAAYNYFAEEHGSLNYSERWARFYPGNDFIDDGNQTQITPVDPLRAGCDIRIFSPEPTPTPLPTWSPPQAITLTPETRTPGEILINEQDFPGAFNNRHYEIALFIAQEALPVDDFDRVRWQYSQALALEALNRLEEAENLFAVIYEANPDSAWGKLAVLHLEQVNP